MNTLNDLSREQFKAFLLTYSSHVDYQFSAPEREIIENQLPEDSDQIIKLFSKLDEHERVKILVEGSLKFLKTSKDHMEFEQALNKQFLADGNYCRFERSFFKYYLELTLSL